MFTKNWFLPKISSDKELVSTKISLYQNMRQNVQLSTLETLSRQKTLSTDFFRFFGAITFHLVYINNIDR